MTNLFFSYSRKDKAIIYPFAQELRELGFMVWIDVSGIKGGTAWSSEIVKAVMDCDFFLLFISSASIHSDSVRREVDLAYKNKKSIIPLRLEKVDIPLKWEYQTIGVQWIECSEQDWKSRLLVALSHGQPGVTNIVSQSVSKPPENIAIEAISENLPARIKFVGREAEKEDLHKSLHSRSKVIEVDGMGGIGKTSLALEIAHECLAARQENSLPNTVAKFDGFIWVDAVIVN